MTPPGYEKRRAYADSLPFRRVVGVREDESAPGGYWLVETLECGHQQTARSPKAAKRRRCWQCGAERQLHADTQRALDTQWQVPAHLLEPIGYGDGMNAAHADPRLRGMNGGDA